MIKLYTGYLVLFIGNLIVGQAVIKLTIVKYDNMLLKYDMYFSLQTEWKMAGQIRTTLAKKVRDVVNTNFNVYSIPFGQFIILMKLYTKDC